MVLFVKHSGPQAPPIDALLAESEREGFAFLRRLFADWQSGANRFASVGEAFYLAIENGNVVGVGGLNIDPYAHDPQVARIRHVYISKNHRRRAIGRGLVDRLIELAKGRFQELRLKTDTVGGDLFYRSIGFDSYSEATVASHFKLV